MKVFGFLEVGRERKKGSNWQAKKLTRKEPNKHYSYQAIKLRTKTSKGTSIQSNRQTNKKRNKQTNQQRRKEKNGRKDEILAAWNYCKKISRKMSQEALSPIGNVFPIFYLFPFFSIFTFLLENY